MNLTQDILLQEALKLPAEGRCRLAQDLWESLEDEDKDASIDPEIEAAWAAEAQRRLEEHRRDPSKAVDAEEFFARIERKFSR